MIWLKLGRGGPELASTFDSSAADGEHIQWGGEQLGSEMRVIPPDLLYRHDVNSQCPP